MRRAMLLVAALALAACSGQSSGGSNGGSVSLVGAGSTFVNPFFSRAFDQYKSVAPNVTVNYQSIGSGGGIEQFTAQTVDFGASDVPMNAKELAAVHGGSGAVLQIPVALGGVAIVYNLEGVTGHLRLPASVLGAIYLGTIAKWNDAQIARANPGVTLPDQPIVVVHRADGSGTTYIFTDYLSSMVPAWKQRVGIGKTVRWPAPSSVGMKGNEGVAGQVKNTPGAIGYVELAYALETSMPYAAVQNRAGALVTPSIASVKAAAASLPAVSASNFSIVGANGGGAYPISGYTWVLLYKHYPDAGKQAALCALFHWIEGDAQRIAPQIDYVDLPPAVAARARATIGPCEANANP